GVYFNIRKLTDIHPGRDGWRIVLDSDMLFFAPPRDLLEWMKSPAQPLFMTDIATSYGRSDSRLQSICGLAVPQKLNVGICALQSEQIDWDEIEEWHRQLVSEGTSYFDEQALLAMYAA